MERTFEGNEGEVFEGDQRLGGVSYVISVWQERVPAGDMENPHATLPGLKSIEGMIEPVGPGVNLWDLCSRGAQLTLRFPGG